MEIRSDDFLTFYQWLGPALLVFVVVVPVLMALAFFFCYLVAAARHGPVEGFYAVAKVIAAAVGKDFPATSLRRVWALTRLTIQESMRRRILIGFVIFALIFLFAGWFLDTTSDDPAHIYLSFVLTTTNYLVIALALFLSTFSLPTDINNKTIYTIVTKPVRPGEIVLGRVFGFTIMITLLLAAMCVISYLFVVRGLRHEHRVAMDSITRMESQEENRPSPGWEGTTTRRAHHRHTWQINNEGRGRTDKVMGHWHEVTATGDLSNPESAAFTVGPPRDQLRARVPLYGKLRFLDREGDPALKGINVGSEWEYRSYIEGRTMAAAIWRFEGLTAREFPDGLPIAMTLSVYRTHKGNIEKGVNGVIIVNSVNPRKPLQCEPIPFESKEFSTLELRIPRKLKPLDAGGEGTQRDLDLFRDLVHEGAVEIWIQCDDAGQYLGMAQADLYIRGPDASFGWNFVKSYIGIWLQMVLVVSLGVMFSTFLTSSVAILATVSAVLLGFVHQFVSDVWTGKTYGGGPIESLIRLVRQDNVMSQLGIGKIPEAILRFVDYMLMTVIQAFASLVPDFAALGRPSTYIAYNFNIHGDLLARYSLTAMVYVVAITLVAYFFLKTREIAA